MFIYESFERIKKVRFEVVIIKKKLSTLDFINQNNLLNKF